MIRRIIRIVKIVIAPIVAAIVIPVAIIEQKGAIIYTLIAIRMLLMMTKIGLGKKDSI